MTDKHKITLTHLNIRQSISILVIKMILIDLLMIATVLLFFILTAQGDRFIAGLAENREVFLFFFGIIGVFKIFVSCYVILEWLNEYYELTPEYILHKHGIILRKSEHYRLNHIREMEIKQTLFGEIFNFATITLFDIRLQKYLDLYLIHNARRYAKVLKELRPQIEMKESRFWLPLRKDDEVLPHE